VPPDTVALNYHWNVAIGENETGFRGKDDLLYRTEGWDFILAGGALYSNLDYSFTPAHPEGDFLDYKSPGGGSPALRGHNLLSSSGLWSPFLPLTCGRIRSPLNVYLPR